MKFLEKLFFILFPLAMLKGTPWEQQWQDQEKQEFAFIAKVFFAVTFIGYILHYYTVDRAEGLAPSELWFNYRYGMALVSAICFLFYSYTKLLNKVLFYRVPAIIAGIIFCYFQTQTIIWYSKIPYLYSFAFVLVCVVILRTTTLKSVCVALLNLVIIYPTLTKVGLSPAMAFSASFFTIAVVIFARAKYMSDLKFFIATQNNITQQKKFIEVNMEFTNQIKAFLPGEIARRMIVNVQEKRMNVIQSIDEVLRPKHQFVACLFSDIRGFTKGSNDLSGFVSKAVFPNVKVSTLAVEKHRGISRKIGDLIFAYFDFEDKELCVEMAFRSAVEVSRLNTEMNANLSKDIQIKRFILLSSGDAIVGNLSGYESSIEITAIGKPVNFLSRIDEVTKHDALKNQLQGGDIILTSDIVPFIKKKFSDISLVEINLFDLGIKVRDFEDTKMIYLFRIGESLKLSDSSFNKGNAA